MKKSFDEVNTSPVYGQIADATAEPAETEAKAEKKSKHSTRINAEFSEYNYEFLKTLARCSGVSMTELLNKIVSDYAETKKDLYNDILKWKNSL